ncbi:MAG: MBL fold metallo-hydrolase [Homoserinimonas sp.]
MLPDGGAATFVPAGHILGAAQVSLRVRGVTLHFTGDVGRPNDPLMFPPRPLHHCDVLVTESTYGNREHQSLDPQTQLSELVTRIAKRNGVVIIPAFAVGRTETLLLHLYRARQRELFLTFRST